MRTADDEKRMLDIMTTVTSSVAQTFPNASVYPVLGNHDSFPVNQMPADSQGFYQKVLDEVGWTKMLTGESKTTFSKGMSSFSRPLQSLQSFTLTLKSCS